MNRFFLRWTQSMRTAVAQEVVALDSKALRWALNKKDSPKFVVSGWAEGNNLVLGQLKEADKSNEITALPELLRALELIGCIVMTDAMGCQKKITKEIKEADAEYVLALKGNQETAHAEVKSFLDAALAERDGPRPPKAQWSKAAANLAFVETCDNDHGWLETRPAITGAKHWTGLRIGTKGKASS